MSPSTVLEEAVRQGAFPGGQLAVSLEGRRVANFAFGSLTPNGPRSSPSAFYDLASLTKPLATSVLIGREVGRERMCFAAPLSEYLPKVRIDAPLAQILDHSAGFPAHVRFDERLPPGTAPASWSAFHHIVEDVSQTPPESPPGERALYSDLGFILLGAALEKHGRAPLSHLFAQLNTPLFYRDRRGAPAPEPFPRDVPFAPTEGGLEGEVHDDNARAMGGAAGHAGLFGTASGVIEVCESLLRAWHGAEGELLRPEVAREMWKASPVPESTRTMGWDRPSPGGSSAGGSWPADGVGHLGFTGTSVWIDPERAFVVALVTNRVCPTRDNDAIRRVRPALHDAARAAWIR